MNALPPTGARSVPGFTPPLDLPGTPGYTLTNLVAGSWIAARNGAVITFVPSAITNVESYQLRYSSASVYKSAEESVVTTIPLMQNVKEFVIVTGLAATDSTANFKVYALTSDGNERGSNAVKVMRM